MARPRSLRPGMNYRTAKEIYHIVRSGKAHPGQVQYIVRQVVKNYRNPVTTKDGRPL